MNRSCLWLCTLTAATAAAVSDARAFSPHGPAGHVFAHLVAGPELRGGPGVGGSGPPPGAIKPPAPPSGNYSFSGNSFNLSVTRNGRPTAPPPPTTPPGGGDRPGFFQRLFNWW
jgi:hypothetical protein